MTTTISTKSLSNYLIYHNDGLSVAYKGRGIHTLDYGTARSTNNPFQIMYSTNISKPSSLSSGTDKQETSFSMNQTISKCPYLRYFECEIIKKGTSSTNSITIGLIPENFLMNTAIGTITNPRIPEFSTVNNSLVTSNSTVLSSSNPFMYSLGYRCDGYKVGTVTPPKYNLIPSSTITGTSSHQTLTSENNINLIYRIQESSYSMEYTEGDRIGCGYNSVTRDIFFTKNGTILSTAFTLPTTLDSGTNVSTKLSTTNINNMNNYYLYPAVSLHSPGDEVRYYFDNGYGMLPVSCSYTFKFNTEHYYHLYIQQQKEKLLSSIIPSNSVIHTIIMDYCLHYGYYQTLELLYKYFYSDNNTIDANRSTMMETKESENNNSNTISYSSSLPWLNNPNTNNYSTFVKSIIMQQNSSKDNNFIKAQEPVSTVSNVSNTTMVISPKEENCGKSISVMSTSSPLSTPLLAVNLPPLSPSLTPLPALVHNPKTWMSPLSLSNVTHKLSLLEEEEGGESLQTLTKNSNPPSPLSSSSSSSSFSSPYFRLSRNIRNLNISKGTPIFQSTTLSSVPEYESPDNTIFSMLQQSNSPHEEIQSSTIVPESIDKGKDNLIHNSLIEASLPKPIIPSPTANMFSSLPSSWMATNPVYQNLQIASGVGTLALPSIEPFTSSAIPTMETISTALTLPENPTNQLFNHVSEFYHQFAKEFPQKYTQISASSSTLPMIEIRKRDNQEPICRLTSLSTKQEPESVASPMDETSPGGPRATVRDSNIPTSTEPSAPSTSTADVRPGNERRISGTVTIVLGRNTRPSLPEESELEEPHVELISDTPLYEDEFQQIIDFMDILPSSSAPLLNRITQQAEETDEEIELEEEELNSSARLQRRLVPEYMDIETGESSETIHFSAVSRTTEPVNESTTISASEMDIPVSIGEPISSSSTVPSLSSTFASSPIRTSEVLPTESQAAEKSTEFINLSEAMVMDELVMKDGIIQQIQHNLQLFGLEVDSSIYLSSTNRPNIPFSSLQSSSSTSVKLSPSLPVLSYPAEIAAHNALLLCYGYGKNKYTSSINSHMNCLGSPSHASYTSATTTKRIRYAIPHTFYDLLSYSDILQANYSTLLLRSRIRSLIHQQHFDQAVEYIHQTIPSILTYPPHASLISLLLSCHRLLLALSVNNIIEAYKILKEDIAVYLENHNAHELLNKVTAQVDRIPKVSPSRSSLINDATNTAVQLHADNIMLADQYSFRQCLSYVGNIITLFTHTATQSSLISLASIIQQYIHASKTMFADVVNTTILEWEYARRASVQFHNQCQTVENIHHLKDRTESKELDEVNTHVSNPTTSKATMDDNGSIGSKRPRQSSPEPSNPLRNMFSPSYEQPSLSDITSESESINEGSTEASTSRTNIAPNPVSTISTTQEDTNRQPSIADLIGLGAIQRFLTSLSPQRVIDSLSRNSTNVVHEESTGFTPESGTTTDDRTTSDNSNIFIHNISGISLSNDALQLWLILRRLFHDPSLTNNVAIDSNKLSKNNNQSSLSKLFQKTEYTNLIEYRIQNFVYNILLQHPDKGCILQIYDLIRKLTSNNYNQLLTTSQSIPRISKHDFINNNNNNNVPNNHPTVSINNQNYPSKDKFVEYYEDINKELSTILSSLFPQYSNNIQKETISSVSSILLSNNNDIYYYPPSFFYSSSNAKPIYARDNTTKNSNSSSSKFSTSTSTSSSSCNFRVSSSIERIINNIGIHYNLYDQPCLLPQFEVPENSNNGIINPLAWWDTLNQLLEN